MAGPQKGSTTAKGRTRREQLLDAALRAFAAQGYRGTSMASIAEQVGLTEPGLLHHFPSKQRLLLGVLEYQEEQVVARVRESAENRSFADALLVLARNHEADPTFIRFFTVLAAESVQPDHPAHEWFVDRYRRLRSLWTGDIAAEQAAGRLRRDIEPEQVADLLIAVLDGLELQHLLDPGAVNISGPLATFLAAAGAPPREP